MSGVIHDGSRDSDKGFEAGEGKYAQNERVEEQQYGAKPSFAQKTKRHCAKWWWVHLIVFCIVFLIIALCLVYVAMPKIAQHDVNASSLEFTDIQFLDPTSGSIVISQKAILHSPSMYTPTLDPFNASLWLVTNGIFSSVPMIKLDLPRIHALHPKSNVSIVGQNATIESLDYVTQYATQVLSQENVTTALTGKTKLHEGKLPVVTVDYNTSTTYKGLNGLKGFNVTDIKMNLSAPTGQPNLKGMAFIPNPSVLTVAMGNVTLNLTNVNGTQIGVATIPDMTIKPGDNSLPMTSIMNQLAVLGSLDKAGKLNMTITGTSAVYEGEHLTYYEKALSSNVLTLQLNVMQILSDSA